MSSQILHKGTIKKVDGDMVTLVLDADGSECVGCAVASFCSKGEEVTLRYPGATPDMKGRRVDVMVTGGMHRLATLLYLAVPVLILVLALAAVVSLGGSNLLAVVVSLAALALWYALMFMLRSHLTSKSGIRIL